MRRFTSYGPVDERRNYAVPKTEPPTLHPFKNAYSPFLMLPAVLAVSSRTSTVSSNNFFSLAALSPATSLSNATSFFLPSGTI